MLIFNTHGLSVTVLDNVFIKSNKMFHNLLLNNGYFFCRRTKKKGKREGRYFNILNLTS